MKFKILIVLFIICSTLSAVEISFYNENESIKEYRQTAILMSNEEFYQELYLFEQKRLKNNNKLHGILTIDCRLDDVGKIKSVEIIENQLQNVHFFSGASFIARKLKREKLKKFKQNGVDDVTNVLITFNFDMNSEISNESRSTTTGLLIFTLVMTCITFVISMKNLQM